ncbi:MAG: GNAT family protein [Thermoanaerobacteraceae bacterium]|nr:GNAT family protein [Thermoanaerobacteraceae bacterium]
MFKGERVELVPFTEEYYEKFVEIRNSEDARDYKIPGVPYPVTVESVRERAQRDKDRKQSGEFAIILNESREYIGNISYHDVDWKNRNCEIGIGIDGEENRNRGLGTEAIRLLLDFLFNEINMHRVYLHVYDFNERAVRCYEKCGFKKEGLIREAVYKHGKYVNEYIMGILEEEFRRG